MIVHSGHPTPITATGLQRYSAFPIAAKLEDGRVFAAWMDAETHYGGTDTKVRYSLSNAAATSWSTPVLLHEQPGFNWAPSGIAVRGNRVALLMNRNSPRSGYVISTTDPSSWPSVSSAPQVDWGVERYPASLAWVENGTTNGLLLAVGYGLGLGIRISASLDNGASWSLWSNLDHLAGFTEAHIAQTASGDLVMTARVDSGPRLNHLQVLRSADFGQTWTDPETIIRNASGHPMVTRLSDDRLVVTVRDKLRGGVGGQALSGGWSLGWSEDHGYTWQVTPVLDDLMMYGMVVDHSSGLVLVGASEVSTAKSDVWARRLTHLHAKIPGLALPVKYLGGGVYELPAPVVHEGDGVYSVEGAVVNTDGRGTYQVSWPQRERF